MFFNQHTGRKVGKDWSTPKDSKDVPSYHYNGHADSNIYGNPSSFTWATVKRPNANETRNSKHCGISIYLFDNSKSIMKKVKINGQVGQGEEDGLVWSGLC